MKTGRVIGTVVSTKKVDSIKNYKILILQPLNKDGEPEGNPITAIDVARAGRGSIVLWTGGREASHALEDSFAPVDASIVGIVDRIDTYEK
jgi:ethanolamine utilization protein EutN